ncbi:uncharacterized protein LOC141856278 isoform X2 [Brevipalpus obovatus]|uniref:uncharacterized protein LOC141856278 isoform X2 n=1 Tax=Brevipalpus obovatus TaxID=246614 RepID=UPI003D9E3876
MATDAVWIIVTIPKKEFETTISDKNRLKKPIYGIYNIGRQNDESMEKILEDTLVEFDITNITWIPDRRHEHWHVYFAVELYDNDAVLSRLKERGIGSKRETSIGYIPFGLFFTNSAETELDEETRSRMIFGNSEGNFKRVQQEFLESVTSRLTVAQVVEGVRNSSTITFDFVAYTFFAGVIAAAALLNNSPVDIAAAMMIEPVIGTVMAVCFGMIIHDRSLIKLGWISMGIVLLMCIVIGFVYGLVFMTWSVEWHPEPDGIWPTGEMEVRGTYKGLIYGLLQAMGAGGAVAISLLNDAQGPLVGVAVASTFLPPHVNTGLLWAYACHLEWRGLNEGYVLHNVSGTITRMKPSWIPQNGYTPHYYDDMRYESLALGGFSLCLTYLNVIGMIFVCYIMLWMKQIAPLGKIEPKNRFFTKDIKEARYYNRKRGTLTANENLGQQILREWAEKAGLDPAQLLSQRPEARVTQFQTLKDLITDVENDAVYRNVTQAAMSKPEPSNNLLRRLTQSNIYGRRKSSTAQGISNLAFVMGANEGGNRYSISPQGKDGQADDGDSNYNQTVNSESSITRGMRLEELEPRGRRKSSVLLRRQLQESDHSPFSVWPTNSSRPPNNSVGRFQVSEVRRRMSSLVSRADLQDNQK